MVAVLAATSYGGWTARSWYDDSQDLKTQAIVKELQDAFRSSESLQARTLENTLQELKANERIIEREKIKIIDRPVYRNECLDADGVHLLNSQRGVKDSDTTEPTD